jgi:hypothetical protein
LLGSCAGRRDSRLHETTPAGGQIGLYRGRLVESGEKQRRFRLQLFVAPPDRVHGEVVSPLGSTVMIVDGGNGDLAVTLVREGVSYVGRARPEILERILGVRLSLAELVRGFLTGLDEERCTDCVVRRSEEERHGMPEWIEFRSADAQLSFELKKVRPLRAESESLGTGLPPDGTRIRGLDELGSEHRLGQEADPS